MSNRPHRSRSQWQDLLNDFASMDISAREFCNDRDLGYASFLRWRRLLSEQTSKPAAPFVDLSSLATTASAGRSGWNVTLDLGDGVILQLERR